MDLGTCCPSLPAGCLFLLGRLQDPSLGWEGDGGKQRAATAGLAVQGARMWGLCLQGGERLLALLLSA